MKIASITPDTTEALYVGEEVEMKVTIDYELAEPSATVSFVIQKGEAGVGMRGVMVGSTSKVISKGKGTVELEQSIVVPDTNTIQVFTPLLTPGSMETRTVDSRAYEVKKNVENVENVENEE